MDFFAILYPLEWVVASVMVAWHWVLTALGLDTASGLTWSMAIVGLVVTIRILLIPLFVKQIKSSRAMQLIAPELRAVQDKYKNKKDQASREAMSRETMALYSKHKTSPFSSCLPMLLQAPIFFALFRVLNYRTNPVNPDAPAAEWTYEGIGLLTPELAAQMHDASLFGALLSDSFIGSDGLATKIVAAVLIVAMVATTFLTQRQLTRKNMPASALEGPMAQQQKIMLYALPFIFVITGPNFPIGVLIYWTTTNLWSMGQQFYVIRRNPTPGSEAEKLWKERQAAKAKKKGLAIEPEPEPEQAPEPEVKKTQRQQPKKSGSRSKRKKGTGAPRDTPSSSVDDEGDGDASTGTTKEESS